jgi:hypothetical protein
MAIASSTIRNGATPPALLTATGNIAVTTMYLCNKSASAVVCSIFVTPYGTVDYGNNYIYSNLTIQSYDTYVLEHERLLLSNGDVLAGNVSTSADNNKIVVTVSYTSI